MLPFNLKTWSVLLVTCLGFVASESLSFIAIGDWGSGSVEQKRTAAAMAGWAETHDAEFIVSLGDNFYEVGVTSVDDPQFNTKWKHIYNQSSIRNLPWYISIGNHDHGKVNDGRERFQVEYGKTEPRWIIPHLWYTFIKTVDSSTIQFVVIDTSSLRSRKNDYRTQRRWFESTLENSEADYLIVVGHHPAYCSGGHGPGSKTMRALLPTMQRHMVDMYMFGHDHNLEHLRRIRNHDIDHVLSGGGGKKLYRQRPKNLDKLAAVGIESVEFFYKYGFVGLTVDDNQIRVEYLDDFGNSLYSFRRVKTRKALLKKRRNM